MGHELIVVGLSHHSAPLAVREAFALGPEQSINAAQAWQALANLRECVVLSTCNRVEVYATTASAQESLLSLKTALKQDAGAGTDVDPYLVAHQGEAAIKHIFRVAASLDSMVVGEPQILGQLKQACALSEERGLLGPLLGRCVERAFAVGKRVRTETQVAQGTVSVSSVACELASNIFGTLSKRRVLLVGAGKMGRSAVRSLAGHGAHIVVMNRDGARAQALASEWGGVPRTLDALDSELTTSDIVITSTASRDFILTYDMMREVIRSRRHRPLFVIDIAVPRNVDPRVGKLDNVFVYDVDDLGKITSKNAEMREKEAEKAEALVMQEVAMFQAWRASLEVTPTIVALRSRFAELVQAELAKTTSRVTSLSEGDRERLSVMADAMINKLLHAPQKVLKDAASRGESMPLVQALQTLFDIDKGTL